MSSIVLRVAWRSHGPEPGRQNGPTGISPGIKVFISFCCIINWPHQHIPDFQHSMQRDIHSMCMCKRSFKHIIPFKFNTFSKDSIPEPCNVTFHLWVTEKVHPPYTINAVTNSSLARAKFSFEELQSCSGILHFECIKRAPNIPTLSFKGFRKTRGLLTSPLSGVTFCAYSRSDCVLF